VAEDSAWSVDVIMIPPAVELEAEWAAMLASTVEYHEPLQRSVNQVFSPSIATNFAVGGRPTWVPLSEVTNELRAQDSSVGPPLIRSGNLEAAASSPSAWTVNSFDASAALPGDAWYGIMQDQGGQAGWSFIPARPFMTLTDTDQENMQRIFLDWYGERMLATGWPSVEF
jgi:phage gpG-like protein